MYTSVKRPKGPHYRQHTFLDAETTSTDNVHGHPSLPTNPHEHVNHPYSAYFHQSRVCAIKGREMIGNEETSFATYQCTTVERPHFYYTSLLLSSSIRAADK